MKEHRKYFHRLQFFIIQVIYWLFGIEKRRLYKSAYVRGHEWRCIGFKLQR